MMPSPDDSKAPLLFAVSSPLLVLAFLVYLARIYTRTRPVFNLGWDDFAISLAMAGAFIVWGLALVAINYGLGRHTYYVSPSNEVKLNYFLFINEPVWVWATTMIKISVALSLLRIKKTIPWKRLMRLVITVQVIIALTSTIIQTIKCRPMRASWDPSVPGARCWRVRDGQVGLYIVSIALIISDIAFSCIPIIFIRTLRRPLSEKIMLVCLMGLGLLASAAAIPKIFYLKYYEAPGDPYWNMVNLSLWAFVEQDIGIVAACVPCLKSPVERFLRRVGILSSEGRPSLFFSFLNSIDQSELRMRSLRSPKSGDEEVGRSLEGQNEVHTLSSDSNTQQLPLNTQRLCVAKDTKSTISVRHMVNLERPEADN